MYTPNNTPKGVIYYIESGSHPGDDARWEPVSPQKAMDILSGYRTSNPPALYDSMIKKRGIWHRGWSWFKFVPE